MGSSNTCCGGGGLPKADGPAVVEEVSAPPPPPADWAGLIDHLAKNDFHRLASEMRLKARPLEVKEGYIKIHLPSGGLKDPNELARELSLALQQVTHTTWQVVVDSSEAGTNGQTLSEIAVEEKAEKLQAAQTAPEVRRVMLAFPGAEVVDILAED